MLKSLSHGINQYIIWEIIEFYLKNIKHFILGPSQPDGSTAFFKKKVGGEDLNFSIRNSWKRKRKRKCQK